MQNFRREFPVSALSGAILSKRTEAAEDARLGARYAVTPHGGQDVLAFCHQLRKNQFVGRIVVELPVGPGIEVNHQDRAADRHVRIEAALQQAHLDMELIHP